MITTFWSWLFKGTEQSSPGWRLLADKKIFLHVLVAFAMLLGSNSDPFEFASKTLFPAASILVSMAVAWTARASTILQDTEFRSKTIKESNPLEAYVYGYQLSLLIIISMVVYVSIMANGGVYFPFIKAEVARSLSGFFLYFLLSLSVAQCWQVIDFSNLLTLLHQRVKS